MPPDCKTVKITLETLLDSVDLAEDIALRVAAAAGFDEDERHKIGMSVREGVINAHNYGNQAQRNKKIEVTVALEPDKMVVRILDQGTGFDLASVPDPLAEENLLRTSGRGLFLMRAFMDEFDVHRGPNGGTELVMAKRYSPAGSGDAKTGPQTH